MLKAYVCVALFVFQYTIWGVRGNGYYGGDNADDSNIGQGAKSHKISGPDTSISSLPQYESAGTGDQNYWWQANNPFQKPANHPGVEKGDSASSTPQRFNQQPSSYQNKPQLHPTSHSRPNVFTPPQNPPFNSQPPAQQQNTPFQSQNPPFNPINSKQPNQQFQQKSPAFASSSQPNSSPYGQHTQNQPQINFPIPVDEECQLMNKADCHQATRNPQTPPLPNTSYQPPPPGPASKPTPFKPHNNNINNNNNGSPQKPSTNYKPPSYGGADDEPINSHLNPQSAGSSNKFSPNQGDIEAPSYGPISDDSSFSSPSDQSPNQPTQNKPNQPFQNNNPFSPNPNKPGNAPHQPGNQNNAQRQPQQPYDNQPAPSSQGPHQSYQGQPGNAYSPQKLFQGPGSRPLQPGNNQQESQQVYDNQAAPSSQRQPQAPQQPFQGPSTKPYSPQKPFQGPSTNTYSPQNTPQRNPNTNNNPQAFRPNPTPQNNFNNNPGQQQRPNNFQSANNQGFAQNSPQSAPRPGNNDSGDQVPYPGCPAAMLCVPDDNCNIKGIIEERPGGLTDAERSHRVAVVACSDPMSGTIGICCRDPNYVDPWPDMNMNGMPKKEHHHHPDKGNNFPVKQGNHQQQASSSFPSNSRQPQNFPQQQSQNSPQQQSQNFPQQQPHQPQQQRNPPQQQYQSQSSQHQPQQQQQQQAQKFGGYPSDGKNGTVNKAQSSNIVECSVHEDCVETYNCQDGYVIQNNSLSGGKGQINLRITTIKSRKCNTLKNGISFACCRRNTINSIKHEIAAASSTNEQTVEAASKKPVYENNYHLQNTFKPQPSRLISGTGRIPGHENIHERFLTNRHNPYSQSQPPIVLLTKPTEKPNKTDVISLMTLSSSKSENNISTTLTEHIKPFAIINKPQVQENMTHIFQGPESAVHLGNTNSSNKTQQENSDLKETNPTIISKTSEVLEKNSSVITDSKLNATLASTNDTLEEEYIPRIVTTTTTPKPYIHNGIPVPLSEEFKQNPPVGCIHKGSEFHIEHLQLPARNYVLPEFEFDDGEETTTTSSDTKNTTLEGEELIKTTTNSFSAISVLPSHNHTDNCPNYMICVDQAICQNVSHDRLNNATSHTQCRLPNSKLTGVCCRSSDEKKNSSTEIAAAASTYSEEHCGIRRSRVAISKNDTSETFFGEFPWQVMILNKSGDFICSGALLDKRTIITTANCIYRQNSSNLIVRVGEWNRHNNLESEPTEDISISSVILHPEYDNSSLKNDIAVVFLNRNVNYDYHIGKVCLPPTNENFESKRCLSTGWAASRKAGSKSSYLKQTDLLVLSQHTCQGRLQYNPNLGKRFIITKGSICARGENQDVCDGDIGDPLVCKSSSGEYQLVGLSVWTRSCSYINVPGVYVNVSYHTQWIKMQMKMISSTDT